MEGITGVRDVQGNFHRWHQEISLEPDGTEGRICKNTHYRRILRPFSTGSSQYTAISCEFYCLLVCFYSMAYSIYYQCFAQIPTKPFMHILPYVDIDLELL